MWVLASGLCPTQNTAKEELWLKKLKQHAHMVINKVYNLLT